VRPNAARGSRTWTRTWRSLPCSLVHVLPQGVAPAVVPTLSSTLRCGIVDNRMAGRGWNGSHQSSSVLLSPQGSLYSSLSMSLSLPTRRLHSPPTPAVPSNCLGYNRGDMMNRRSRRIGLLIQLLRRRPSVPTPTARLTLKPTWASLPSRSEARYSASRGGKFWRGEKKTGSRHARHIHATWTQRLAVFTRRVQ
jgi:hypothetical protein